MELPIDGMTACRVTMLLRNGSRGCVVRWLVRHAWMNDVAGRGSRGYVVWWLVRRARMIEVADDVSSGEGTRA